MLTLVVPIAALLTGISLLLLGSGLLNTLLAIRGGLEGYTDSAMGMIMSGYFLGFFVGTFLALPLIQRVGHIRTFACCAALASSSVLLHALFVSPLSWLLLRVMTGTVLVILYTVTESWLNAQTSGPQRGRVFALYMAVNLGALAIAQQLLRLGSAEGFLLFALAAILISVSLVPITLTRMQQPHVSIVPRLKVTAIFRISPVAVAGALLSGLAMGGFWGLGAIYASRIGLDSHGVATFMSCAILGGALFQFPLGRYSDTHDRRKVLAVVTGLAALVACGLWATSYVGDWVLMAAALYGGFAFAVYPVSVAMLMDDLEPDNILSGASCLLFLHGLGAAIGPAVAGQFMSWSSHQALTAYFVVVQLALCLFAVQNLQRSKAAPSEHPIQFVPMVRTTPTVLEMLPEDEEDAAAQV
ncbi:MFS transporter [Aestuariicella hydrocarbonica]|uniref:MFS transporter n=1 Tax=Pseudomaricurvus hydrocarbonicus TaxID=1470433 RepID=A0A9E5MP73_9GAMM|nr:MFS transporter [Aestuariicella hydrocarbonica]NHO67918.1 MFS transporter [Aestuariicella hydrocarbonica]